MSGAMQKDDQTGEVLCDTDKCVGCWMCVMVCPFGAVQPGEVYVVKCDGCPEREEPGCVDACPTGALFVADSEKLSEVIRERREKRKGAVKT